MAVPIHTATINPGATFRINLIDCDWVTMTKLEASMREMSGGCLCGKVRYSANVAPVITLVCHCKNCQRQAGTAFALVVGVPKAALNIDGALRTFEDVSTDGNPVHRRFCPECGSPIVTDVDAMADLTFIKAGTLDDTSWLDPTMHLWCESAQPWVRIPDTAKQFQRMPG